MRWLAVLLLASCPTWASWDPDQVWCFDPVPGAEAYFLGYSDGTHSWVVLYSAIPPETCIWTREPMSSAGKRLIYIQVSVVIDGVEQPIPEARDLPQWLP